MLKKIGALLIVILIIILALFYSIVGFINLGIMFWFNIWLGLFVFIFGLLLFSSGMNSLIISIIAAYALINQHDWGVFYAISFALFPKIADFLIFISDKIIIKEK